MVKIMGSFPQPPPDVLPPPPGVEAVRSRKWMWAILLLGGLAVVSVSHFVILPRDLRAGATRNEALANARQIGLMLLMFESEYGRFPDATTIGAVKAATSTAVPLGDGSSNELLRQLLVVGSSSEKPFHAQGVGVRKPDDVFSGSHALAPGECGFAYIPGFTSAASPAAPVALAPVVRGAGTFDRKALDGSAVILFSDGSVRAIPIDRSGRVTVGGMDLFDSSQPFWGGTPPDLKWQE